MEYDNSPGNENKREETEKNEEYIFELESESFEKGHLAVDLYMFTGPHLNYPYNPLKPESPFVSEVILQRDSVRSEWINIVPVNDKARVRQLLRSYFVDDTPKRLYRADITVIIYFKYWISGEDTLKEIQRKTVLLLDAVQRLEEWVTAGKAEITQHQSHELDFLPTPEIFEEVRVHPAMHLNIYENDMITLAQGPSSSFYMRRADNVDD